ncbi:MAG: hypothetical protein QF464_24010, partial [Myxococcota bacterium]|nr:hypothetical protein [Myxococcota bacterium]
MVHALSLSVALLCANPPPQLPIPPPPPSPSERLSSHLATALLGDDARLAPHDVYQLQASVEGGPESLGAFICDALEVALRRA